MWDDDHARQCIRRRNLLTHGMFESISSPCLVGDFPMPNCSTRSFVAALMLLCFGCDGSTGANGLPHDAMVSAHSADNDADNLVNADGGVDGEATLDLAHPDALVHARVADAHLDAEPLADANDSTVDAADFVDSQTPIEADAADAFGGDASVALGDEPVMCAIHVWTMGRSFFWTFYIRDGERRVVRRESVDRNGHQYTSAVTRFSRDGMTSSSEYHRADGALQYTASSEYNRSGKPTRKVSVRPNGDQWKITVYLYDDEQQLLEEVETRVSSGEAVTKTYGYDDVGNRLSETIQGAQGISRTDYTYDERNRLTSERRADAAHLVETIDYHYEFNDADQIHTVQETHRESGELRGRSIYNYTDDGQLFNVESINRQGQRDAQVYYLCDTLDILD
jgi:hypothetical protein